MGLGAMQLDDMKAENKENLRKLQATRGELIRNQEELRTKSEVAETFRAMLAALVAARRPDAATPTPLSSAR